MGKGLKKTICLLTNIDVTIVFQGIDNNGGWPQDAKWFGYDGMEDNTVKATFYNYERKPNTVICTADQYYWWKLSPVYKNVINQAIRNGRSVESEPCPKCQSVMLLDAGDGLLCVDCDTKLEGRK